jgi:diacylglycerol O-acyltransferase
MSDTRAATRGPVRYQERMGETDALMWNIERDPMLRSTILSVMILDRAPDEARFRGAIERSLRKIPRLTQHVALDPLGAAPPRWEADRNFDLSYHVRRVRGPGKGTLRELLDLAAPLAMQAFDKDRPLWELVQVDDLEYGQTAILLKLHHSVSDGVGLVRMTSSLVERSREPDPAREGRPASVFEEPGPADERSAFRDALDALRYRAESNLERTGRAAGALGSWLGRGLRDPLGAVRDGGRMASSLARSLRPFSKPLSPVMVGRSLGLRFDAFALPLEDLRRAAKAAGGTLNDAFVAALAGGLRRYHEQHGKPVDELRMTMPINLRRGEEGRRAGNQFAPARFAVPIAIADPAERMRAIHERVRHERDEPALPLAEEIAATLARLPRGAAASLFGSMLKAIDFVASNVPGPEFPVYASGAQVVRMFGFGPLSGAAANITLFSYDGQVHFGVNTDRAAVVDPEAFVAYLREGVDEVVALGQGC